MDETNKSLVVIDLPNPDNLIVSVDCHDDVVEFSVCHDLLLYIRDRLFPMFPNVTDDRFHGFENWKQFNGGSLDLKIEGPTYVTDAKCDLKTVSNIRFFVAQLVATLLAQLEGIGEKLGKFKEPGFPGLLAKRNKILINVKLHSISS